MYDPISSSDLEKEILASAREVFKDHQKRDIGHGHWIIKNPTKGEFWTEIVVMSNIGLTVWGDIDSCTFAYCSGEKDPRGVVSWIANSSIDYCRQKANIGTCCRKCSTSFNECVAIYDLQNEKNIIISECEDGIVKEDRKDNIVRIIDEAIQSIKFGTSIEDVHNQLFESLDEFYSCSIELGEFVYSVGEMTSSRVIYAKAASECLNRILVKEKHNALRQNVKKV